MMPIVNGPYHDPLDDEPGARHKAPKALRRLRKQFTEDKQLAAFRSVFDHEPANDKELEIFADTYITEMYNGGRDNL
jgi:hypothetical protein